MAGSFPPGPAGRARWTLELVRVLAPRELRTRYRQSVLDIAWALISFVATLALAKYLEGRPYDA